MIIKNKIEKIGGDGGYYSILSIPVLKSATITINRDAIIPTMINIQGISRGSSSGVDPTMAKVERPGVLAVK